jgi:hypothetical protein
MYLLTEMKKMSEIRIVSSSQDKSFLFLIGHNIGPLKAAETEPSPGSVALALLRFCGMLATFIFQ